MIIIIPECQKCKTSKNVIMDVADIKDRAIWFDISYCGKCFEVISCSFRGRRMEEVAI
jgi:hypothetical protein